MYSESLTEIVEIYFKKSVIEQVKKGILKDTESYYLHRYLSTYYLIKGQMEKGVTELNGHGVESIHQLYTSAIDELNRLKV